MLDVPPQRPICTLSGGPKLAQPPLYRVACFVALDELAKVTRGRSGEKSSAMPNGATAGECVPAPA